MSDRVSSRPYFLWDYNLTEAQVRDILRGQNEVEKGWLLSRILESARFEDVWKFTTLTEVAQWFPKLKMKPTIAEAWQRALNVWQKPTYAN